jgi:hypothetical protein
MRMINNAAGRGTAILLAELDKAGPAEAGIDQDAAQPGTATRSSRRFLRLSFPLEPTP